jgi:hypothetical protein
MAGTTGSPGDAQSGAIDTPGPDTGASGGCPGPAKYASAVLDPRTCLVWQAKAGAAMTNVQAAKYCDRLVQDGLADWRVPAPEELATWPNLPVDSSAFITNPTYIPAAATVAEGCMTNSHSCNLSQYNLGSIACAWQGVGFTGPTICVRGSAKPGTTVSKVAATMCEACKVHLTGNPAEFKQADCLPFAP